MFKWLDGISIVYILRDSAPARYINPSFAMLSRCNFDELADDYERVSGISLNLKDEAVNTSSISTYARTSMYSRDLMNSFFLSNNRDVINPDSSRREAQKM